MDSYIDMLAPWEWKNAYYNNVKLGWRVKDVKRILKTQTEEMIKARIASAEEIILSQYRLEDVIKEIGYDIKRVELGMGWLKAAFEWGISDVVWFIEKDTNELQDIMKSLFWKPDVKREMLKKKAEVAYAKGKMDDALESLQGIGIV